MPSRGWIQSPAASNGSLRCWSAGTSTSRRPTTWATRSAALPRQQLRTRRPPDHIHLAFSALAVCPPPGDRVADAAIEEPGERCRQYRNQHGDRDVALWVLNNGDGEVEKDCCPDRPDHRRQEREPLVDEA